MDLARHPTATSQALAEGRLGGPRKYATPAEATAAHRAGTKANNARRAEAGRGWEPARCKRGCRVPEWGGSKRPAVSMLKH